MRFVSSATRAKYVMKPKYTTYNGPTPEIHAGLSARFFGHVFDSLKSQRELGWTDEERRSLETYLKNHQDFNRAGGIYLENIVDNAPVPDMPTVTRCIAFFVNEANESEQCPNPPLEGSDYCDAHQPIKASTK